jgi:hypothetical protein
MDRQRLLDIVKLPMPVKSGCGFSGRAQKMLWAEAGRRFSIDGEEKLGRVRGEAVSDRLRTD